MSRAVGTARHRPTPGPAGYLLAVLVSIVVTDLLLVVTNVPLHSLERTVTALFVGLVYVCVFALPIAPLGVLLVHLSCRRVENQAVHVLAAGAAGALTGLLLGARVDAVSGLAGMLSLSVILGLATSTGRAAVIPLRPIVPMPVDSDFAPGGSAC